MTSISTDSIRSPKNGALEPYQLATWREEFEATPVYRMSQNAVCKNAVDEIALNRQVVTQSDFTFSHVLDDWTVTNQKNTGRCWMFAGLNLFRVGAMKRMNLKDFQFSQSYTFFWDKLERSNYFLERHIEMANHPVDDRRIAWLLDRPLDDGGQWNMFVNIIKKHGLVPQSVMPETESSSNSSRMNSILLYKLREGAKTFREMAAKNATLEALRDTKTEILEVVYRILSVHLGTPPTHFDWQWNDADKQFHRDGEMTPQDFAAKYVTLPIDDYVCLVNDPRATSPFGRTFTVECLGNVEGGNIVKYLNVEIDLMKQIAMQTVIDGEPVWMGCDVGKMMQRNLGLWDAKLYDYDGVYDTTFTLDKSARLQYHQTLMTHAMLFTGVDVVSVDGQEVPRRWRVENSWGEDSGQKGFYLMNDNWFDQYMFEIAARKDYLPDELRDALELEPIVLPPWDPMGALAHEAWTEK
ncbi:MAG: C1 family peptidase [Candidatus Poribacteria bacterium]|nr:C1 family peptidase [Candidatus Poribacteria bacterium]